MKNFLIVFLCAEKSVNHLNWMKLSQDKQNERVMNGNTAMEHWQKKYKHKIIHEGSSLSKKTISIDSSGSHETPSKMGKFILVEAASHEEAAHMFLDHPHFKYFPGDGVDILELV